MRSAPVSRQHVQLQHSAKGHHHNEHSNVQLDAKDYGSQNLLGNAGETMEYNLHAVSHYEGEINEDKRLFAFEDPGDY